MSIERMIAHDVDLSMVIEHKRKQFVDTICFLNHYFK
jgi:hypothetical protein